MKILGLFLFLASFCSNSFAQKIDYTIPKGFESDISKKDYKKLVDESVAAISTRYKIYFVKDGGVELKEGQGMDVFYLDNLLLKCKAEPDKSKWSAVIKEHFDNLFASIDDEKKLDVKNFETIKNALSIRIYTEDFTKNYGGTANMIVRKDLEGTYTVLMLDLPTAFVPVQKEIFDLWKKDATEVFKIAQANVNKQEVEKEKQTFNVGGVKVDVTILSNEDYASSYALDLQDNSPELVGEWGCAVAIPNKGLVNVCAISQKHPLDFVKFIQVTKSLVEKAYNDHPQRISNQYFWYYKGKFTAINVTQDSDGKINVIAPQGLSELMSEKK